MRDPAEWSGDRAGGGERGGEGAWTEPGRGYRVRELMGRARHSGGAGGGRRGTRRKEGREEAVTEPGAGQPRQTWLGTTRGERDPGGIAGP